MNSQFITLSSCFQGIFLNVFEPALKSLPEQVSIPEKYHLIRWIKRQGGDNGASVGIFRDQSGALVIIKHLRYRWKNLTYRYILNEVSLLARVKHWSFSSQSGKKIMLPVMREMRDEAGELMVIKEFVEGETLDTLPIDMQRLITEECLLALQSLTREVECPAGRRTAWQIGVSFPFYWLRVLLKDPLQLPLLLRLMWIFYWNWPSTVQCGYVLSHRDLYLKNILTNASSVVILDFESMALCTEGTDAAQAARFNLEGWGKEVLSEFVSDIAPEHNAKKSFSALSIYYGIQMMTTDRLGGIYYQEALKYLRFFSEKRDRFLG